MMFEGCECMKDLNVKIDGLKSEQKEIMRDIRNLETRIIINEKDISIINK
jgi:hypothetical protein